MLYEFPAKARARSETACACLPDDFRDCRDTLGFLVPRLAAGLSAPRAALCEQLTRGCTPALVGSCPSAVWAGWSRDALGALHWALAALGVCAPPGCPPRRRRTVRVRVGGRAAARRTRAGAAARRRLRAPLRGVGCAARAGGRAPGRGGAAGDGALGLPGRRQDDAADAPAGRRGRAARGRGRQRRGGRQRGRRGRREPRAQVRALPPARRPGAAPAGPTAPAAAGA